MSVANNEWLNMFINNQPFQINSPVQYGENTIVQGDVKDSGTGDAIKFLEMNNIYGNNDKRTMMIQCH